MIDSSFFDAIHDRTNTCSIKYDMRPKGNIHNNLIPMWVADMDFKIPPCVEAELIKVTTHGIFGYSYTDDEYDSLFVSWYKKRMGWDINTNHILKTPAVMFAISSSIRALTETGDSILICEPVYYPFAKVVSANLRKLVVSELILKNNRYEIDFMDFEDKVIKNSVKLFILCSPHNPVGRVWSKDELLQIGQICLKHGVIIVSDEIHSDFIYNGYRHIPIASLSDELANQTVTCTSPTKTFNIAGLQVSNVVIPNDGYMKRVRNACKATGYESLNTMAIAAAKAAYRGGEQWFNTLMSYLQDNVSLVKKQLDGFNAISLIDPEATYLMWLDCRKLGKRKELDTFFIEKAGVWLHNGANFGAGGDGFMRMNIACPKAVLNEALLRIKKAYRGE